jgi:hypothetical protein
VLAKASAPVDDFLPGEAPVATPTFHAPDRSWDRLIDIVAAPASAPVREPEPEGDTAKPQRVGIIDIRFVDVR